jgi:hypothetical protein
MSKARRFVAMSIPGRAEGGSDTAWFAYDRTLRQSVGEATTSARAAETAKRLNAEARPPSPGDFQLVAVPGARFTVETGHSQYGTRRPRITVRVPKQHPHRTAVAIAHQLAARAEAMTPPEERWLVQVESYAMREATVFLELVDDADREAEAGIAMLRVCWR